MRLLFGLCAAAIACLLFTSAAMATVTHTSLTVTSPHGRYLVVTAVDSGSTLNSSTQISVSGTSDGTTGDSVDINCYRGATSGAQSLPVLLASGVPVSSNGSFTYTSTGDDLYFLSGENCILRAVPAGDDVPYPPGAPGASSFAGPVLSIGLHQDYVDETAPNQGRLEDYRIYAPQPAGEFDYSSLGNCGLYESYVYDPSNLNNQSLDECNGGMFAADGAAPAHPAPGEMENSRSELKVDDKNSYLPGSVAYFKNYFSLTSAEGLSGFPGLSYRDSLDPANGNLVIQETDQVVQCAPSASTYPPTSKSCTRFVPAGIAIHVRWIQDHAGRVTSELQTFSSTDGHSHPVDLLEDNSFNSPNHDGELDFPWTSQGMQPYTTVGQSIPGPSHSGPGSFFAKASASVPDGGEDGAQGEVTFSNPPSSEVIAATTNSSNGFDDVLLHYARTVPARGSLSLGFTYADAFFASEVQAYAAAAAPTFAPSVAISKPGRGAKLKSGLVTVSGTAHDSYGVTSVSVNGVKAKLGSKGSWQAKLHLKPGSDALTALATNIFANTARASVKVSFPLTLTNLMQSHSKWKESQGTRFSFVLDAPARVAFNFTRKGHSVGKLSFQAKAGHDTRSFDGKLGAKKLKPGNYSASVSAKAEKAKTKAKTLHFTITG
jgi:hypothetical protein